MPAPRSPSSRSHRRATISRRETSMIITRSPLRITLGGGGTDLPSYYREHGGFLIAAAIDKYVYVTVMRPFVAGHLSRSTRSSSTSTRSTKCSIRSSAKRSGCSDSGRRRSRSPRWPTSPPAPASARPGSFTTALLKALYAHRRRLLHPSELARAGLRDRDRPAGRADRQAGSVHRRVRRRHLLHLPSATTASTREPLKLSDGHAVRSRRQPAAVLHRLLAQRRRRS